MATKSEIDLDWKGKIVLFYAKSAGPELGTGMTAILVEDVFHFVIFDSLEDFQRRIKNARFNASVNSGENN